MMRYVPGPLTAISAAGYEMGQVVSGYRPSEAELVLWLSLTMFWAAWSFITPALERARKR